MVDNKKLSKEETEKVSGGTFENRDTRSVIECCVNTYRGNIGYGTEESAKIYQKYCDMYYADKAYTIKEAMAEFKKVSANFEDYLRAHALEEGLIKAND